MPVTITSRRDGLALVDGALKAGDRVIVEGVQKIRDGQVIRLVRPSLCPRPMSNCERPPKPATTMMADKSDLPMLAVKRPLLVGVLLPVIAGLAAFAGIEVRELPNVDRSIVSVTACSRGCARNHGQRGDERPRRCSCARYRGAADQFVEREQQPDPCRIQSRGRSRHRSFGCPRSRQPRNATFPTAGNRSTSSRPTPTPNRS